MIVALDANPLLLPTQRRGVPEADACRAWAEALLASGATLLIPAIADYEIRRELIRAAKTTSVARLDALRANPAFQYAPITDEALLRASTLWADVRNRGLPTANPAELDCDVILVAILLTTALPIGQIIIATSNPGHLSRFMPAETWQAIHP